jgi:hypothetical protein
MYCPKCGEENPDDAKLCHSCSSALSGTPAQAPAIAVKTSGLAIAALVLGILSIFTVGLTILPAIICGIIGLVKIEKSGGRVTGRAFAIIGIVSPVLLLPLLMAILMPALARVRQIAFRQVCGTNLSGIGRAMLLYSNDYDDELPRSGGRDSGWATQIPNWQAANRFQAYGSNADGTGGTGSITSCFYLLVKYAEVTPKSFICKGDIGAREFTLAEYGVRNKDIVDLWDFGGQPGEHCSYSYHMPFGLYALTMSSAPGMAVAADRNPWMESPSSEGKADMFARFNPTGRRDYVKIGNAIQHQEDGQNVLFLDSHVSFEKSPCCGIDDDNIYTRWGTGDLRVGLVPGLARQPMGRLDSLLVHDAHGSPPLHGHSRQEQQPFLNQRSPE